MSKEAPVANIKKLDPGASPLHYFGAELRRLRLAAGLTLAQLGTRAYMADSAISQFETATKVPREEHIPRLDAALNANGALLRAWEMVKRQPLPAKLRQVAKIEASARQIFIYHPQLVDGLLQIEGYARAVLGVLDRENLEQNVAARLARQRLLQWDEPPLYWVVLGEAVLHQAIGGRKVMRDQLAHLLDYRHTRHVHIQVLPFDAGVHAGMSGAFHLYTYEDQPTIAYRESYGSAEATVNPQDVRDRWLRYDLLQATALSPEDSAELIGRVMEERYGNHPEAGQPPVA